MKTSYTQEELQAMAAEYKSKKKETPRSFKAAKYDLSEDPMDLGKANRLWKEDSSHGVCSTDFIPIGR